MKVGRKQSNGRWWQHANNSSKYAQCTSSMFCVWNILVNLLSSIAIHSQTTDGRDRWIRGLYTDDRGPSSRFIVWCSVWMCQASNAHLWHPYYRQSVVWLYIAILFNRFTSIFHTQNIPLVYIVHMLLLLLACCYHLPLLCFLPTFISRNCFPPFMCI